MSIVRSCSWIPLSPSLGVPQVVRDGPGSLRHRHPHRPAGHQRLERPGAGPQALVPVPHAHAPPADQGAARGRRQPAGRGGHLVLGGVPAHAAARLARRVPAPGDPAEGRGDRLCTRSVIGGAGQRVCLMTPPLLHSALPLYNPLPCSTLTLSSSSSSSIKIQESRT